MASHHCQRTKCLDQTPSPCRATRPRDPRQDGIIIIKKIVIGGASAALLVAGAASAAQLTGVSDTTLAGSQVTFSGAELEGIDFTTDYIGGNSGNGAKTNVLTTVTIDLDKAGVTVTGRILQDIGGASQDFRQGRGRGRRAATSPTTPRPSSMAR